MMKNAYDDDFVPLDKIQITEKAAVTPTGMGAIAYAGLVILLLVVFW